MDSLLIFFPCLLLLINFQDRGDSVYGRHHPHSPEFSLLPLCSCKVRAHYPILSTASQMKQTGVLEMLDCSSLLSRYARNGQQWGDNLIALCPWPSVTHSYSLFTHGHMMNEEDSKYVFNAWDMQALKCFTRVELKNWMLFKEIESGKRIDSFYYFGTFLILHILIKCLEFIGYPLLTTIDSHSFFKKLFY